MAQASSPKPQAFPRLYPILDVDACSARDMAPVELLDVWLDAGIRLVQLRAKHLASGAMLTLCDGMALRCRAAGARFVVNDRADIARMSGADGVHVGQDDLSPADARLVVGDEAMVGWSTHDEGQLAAALRQPVSYVAIGPVFATSTKEHPDPVVGLDMVRRAAAAAREARVPLVAIGGITISTAPSVIEAGADAVAVIADLLAGDPRARVREYLRALVGI